MPTPLRPVIPARAPRASRASVLLACAAAFVAGCDGKESVAPNMSPDAAISAPGNGTVWDVGTAITFQGTGSDDEDGAITGSSLAWSSSADGALGTGSGFQRSDLSTGSHTITLTATDSEGATGSATVQIVVNVPPTAAITAPAPGSAYQEGEDVVFEGSGADAEDGVLTGTSLAWSSDRDGALGTGSPRTVSDLSAGRHVVTLTATDGHGATATATVTVDVNGAPTPQITAPGDGSVHHEGADVTFEGSASDPEDGALSGAELAWSSDVDGDLGTGTSVTRGDLTPGAHTVTLTATDSDGATASTSVNVVVNALPVPVIDAPGDGSVHGVGDDVAFDGSAGDAEDGALSGGSLVWTSDVDGQIGTGPGFVRDDLTEGDHVVTLTATDSDGGVGTATVEISVNSDPVASITSPTDGASFAAGAGISFQGSGTDPQGGTLTGSALVWTSDVDGQLGTGDSFARSNLSVGDHVITLTVTDGDGATGSASVGITVTPPGIAIGQSVTNLSGAAGTARQWVLTLTAEGDAAFAPAPAVARSVVAGGEGAVRTGARPVLPGSSTESRGRRLEVGEASQTSFLRIAISGGTGDADLYVRHGAPPTGSVFDCRPFAEGNTETCDFESPAAGSWYILIHAYEAYSGVTLTISDGSCTLASPDSDGDRLPDCAETNDGNFVNSLQTGTDPSDPDTDGDGLRDGDEVLGTTGGLDLPGMGTHPLRQDILLEHDWIDDSTDGGSHSHRPTAAAIAAVNAMFSAAPTSNPDGSSGINVIHDYGQGGIFTAGNVIGHPSGNISGGVGNSEFQNLKAANFPANRHGYFHWVLHAHRYGNPSNGSSGQAEINGDDLMVTLQTFLSTRNISHTIVHELGHNLGLLHGGFENTNWKPNYNSVMNYKYQFPGIDNDCTPPGNGVLDFSRGIRPSLNENNLDETKGVCGGAPGWDWNGDSDATDVGIAVDINRDNDGNGDGFLGTLQDFDDWGNIYFLGINDGDGFPALKEVVVESCQDTPHVHDGGDPR